MVIFSDIAINIFNISTVMKNIYTASFLGAVLALSVGVIGFNTFDSATAEVQSTMQTGAIQGHVTMFVTLPDGTISEYVQTDNHILDQGDDCTVKRLFIGTGSTSGTNTELCVQEVGTFNKIVLLTGGSCTPAETHTTLAEGSCTFTGSGTTGMGPVSVTIGDSASVPAGSGGQTAIDIDNTFTNTSGGTVTVTAAALTNSTSDTATNHHVFAKTDISPDVAVTNNSDLTVQWDLTIGG